MRAAEIFAIAKSRYHQNVVTQVEKMFANAAPMTIAV
jgi:hypothetical protein